ncbi:MAG TPA: hypothetical protein VL334_21680 [Anaerolineae bacterium]|nr:hypothetical protein [Anaerolineae bacterium]
MKAKKQVDRRAIIISAVLTVLLLTGAGSAALASNWLAGSDPAAQGAPQGAVESGPIVVTVEPLFSDTTSRAMAAAPQVAAVDQATANEQVVTAYETQLNQAYQALQEAYAQIETLQSNQTQIANQAGYDDRHDDEHEHSVTIAGHGEDHDDD